MNEKLRALAGADLARSGLALKQLKTLGFEVLDGPKVAALDGGTFKPLGALKLNYYDPHGKDTGFYRIKYLENDSSIGKKKRYVQPTGTSPKVYYAKGQDWVKVLGDARVALHLTEGEKKAVAGCLAGFPTLGLGGVWSWKSAKRGEAIIPELLRVNWKERTVYLVFDSDAATKPDVVKAQLALAEALTGLGSRPTLITLPPGLKGEKQGMDDFLVAQGKRGYDELVKETLPFAAASELWSLNGEVAYVKDPGLVVVLNDARKLSPAAFTQHAYANRHYYETMLRPDGSVKLVKKPVAPAWLSWEHRFELERLTYAPGQERITNGREYNHWRGWGVEPKRGEVKPWRDLLDFLFKEQKAARRWFEQWCAYPLQHPGEKMYSSAVIWGVIHGTGKTLVGYSLLKIYGNNGTEVNEQHLRSPFNEWAESKQFVMGDEITGSDHRREADRLKSFITQQQLRINMKHIPSYVVPDCINYYFTSNHPDSFFMEDTDRRMFVHEIVGGPRERGFYEQYEKWLLGDGAAALFDHLLKVDLAGFDAKGPALMTQAKEVMIIDAKSDLGSWVHRLKTDPGSILRMGGEELQGDLFTNEELLALYDPDRNTRVTANGLGRELRRAGIRYANGGSVVLTSRGPQRLYVLRGDWHRAKPRAAAAHYDARFLPVETTKKEKKYG